MNDLLILFIAFLPTMIVFGTTAYKNAFPWKIKNEEIVLVGFKKIAKLLGNRAKFSVQFAEYPISPFSAIYGWYNNEERCIYLNLRAIRSHKQLVHTFVHELCHHMQNVDGRLYLDRDHWYIFRPCEIEARAFTRAWFRASFDIYQKAI